MPIGGVLVHRQSGEIVARGGNRTIEQCDPTSHAEIQVIRDVCQRVGAQRIPEYDLYVTLEPCPMCAAAISFARIGTVYFGAADPKSGGITSAVDLYSKPQIHHKPQIVAGILEEDCAILLREFFKARRSV